MSESAGVDQHLGLLCVAFHKTRLRDFDGARKALAVMLLIMDRADASVATDLRAAWTYCTLFLQTQSDPASVPAAARDAARKLLEKCGACATVELFQTLMFDLLIELKEHRAAIPFGEQAAALAVAKGNPIEAASKIWQTGRCYLRSGLRDHAAIVLAAAVRLFRSQPDDPRLPAVLLDLANSISKSAPGESEAVYKEAAAIWEGKGQFDSATPAWVNLGILLGKQERFEEALDYFKKAAKVRERSKATSKTQIGTLHNNLANCYRRMGRFDDAQRSADLALAMLQAENGPYLGSAMGTRGLILRDQGRDAEAIEWFQKACAQQEKQSSPNLQTVIEELEYMEAALRRLNRTEEADQVQRRIAETGKTLAAISASQVDTAAVADIQEGAVLLEIEIGLRDDSAYSSIVKLGLRLGEELDELGLGRFSGVVRILEQSTLIFYGPDAFAMYERIDSMLESEPGPEVARAIVRQGAEQREIARRKPLIM